MIRILFLTRRFEAGGAERQLIELVKGLDKARFSVTVVAFYAGGALFPEIESVPNIQVFSLAKAGRCDVLPFLWRLWCTARAARPHILYGYMGVANELCLLVGRMLRAKVVWGLRSSNMDFARYDWAAGWIFRLGAWLSSFPDLIILNSQAGMRHHLAHGYAGRCMVVIPNGIDVERYRVDQEAGQRIRAEWGVGPRETLIGLVARLDPMKDHPTFLRAAAQLVQEQPNVRFVCVGDGPAAFTAELRALSLALGVEKWMIWAGARADVPAVHNALDIASSSSSFGEGFSNAVGEAMACGVPCVVTDTGDSAMIVATTGVIVPSRDATALAEAWKRLLNFSKEEQRAVGVKARERIVEEFNIRTMVARTETAFKSFLAGIIHE